MKKLLFKYVVLVILTFFVSILIYNYIESFKPVETEKDVLLFQHTIENEIFNGDAPTIENPKIILNPYGNSPLSAIVIFQTSDLTTPSITVEGKDNNDLNHTFIPSKLHILPIYGLYPGCDNKITISASEKTKEITIKTDDLPNDFPKTDVIKSTDSDDFYFTSFENSKYMAAYDSHGNVRWYTDKGYNWEIQRLNNGHILVGNGKIINKNYSASLIEMDLLGKEYFEYLIPGGYHHGCIELSNGNLLAISSNIDGEKNNIIEIDRNTGAIINEIELNDLLDKDDEITSLTYDSKTNSILVSLSKENKIVSIDYAYSNTNFIIGNDVPADLKEYVVSGNEINSPENITSLDNGNFTVMHVKDGKKYLSEYYVNYGVHSYEEIKSFELDNINNEYLMAYGNTIKENEFELKLSSNIYNVKKMEMYSNDIYSTVNGVRLGSLGKSSRINDYPILTTENADEIIKKHNIKLYKDVFGLKVSGNFNKNDKVEIILDNVLDKKAYSLKISEGESSRYINEEGIKGKYYIYLNINGKVYKLYKYVTFK